MATRAIRMFGDPVLRQRALEVETFDRAVGRLIDDLVDTLTDAGGAGLAAPQIGVGRRAFAYRVVDERDPNYGGVGHIVNPVLTEVSQELVTDFEGCLSIPHVELELARPRRMVARGFDREGAPLEVVGTERLARCLAHETDHLDGVLFIDRLDPDARKRAMREIRERQLAGEDAPTVEHSPHSGLL